MRATFWDAFRDLPLPNQLGFGLALLIAFAFEIINGFHDTANAVTTVIYTGTLKPRWAVLYSGVLNFLGVLLGGTAVAFSIVNLLPVDLLIQTDSARAVVMVVSLLLAGVIWNLSTWYVGLPVSSSHTLIGAILGVGLANSLSVRGDLSGVNWTRALEAGLSLLISPLIGFASAAGLLRAMKRVLREPRLYHPPVQGDQPPRWVRWLLIATCGGVSLGHGSNDGQKGTGLILLVLIGFLPAHYALDVMHPARARQTREAAAGIDRALDGVHGLRVETLRNDMRTIASGLDGLDSFAQVPASDRWRIRQSIYRFRRDIDGAGLPTATLDAIRPQRAVLTHAIEYVPTWVVAGVALALGVGTMVGYRRVVVTVAEKIGKAHLTYGQGAAAELVAAATIALADVAHMPVSTTQVLSSGVAGTMWANRSGIQRGTFRKIGLAWAMTLPVSFVLAATLFVIGGAVAAPTRPTLVRGYRAAAVVPAADRRVRGQ